VNLITKEDALFPGRFVAKIANTIMGKNVAANN